MQCNHGCGVVAATALSLLICDHFSRKVVLEKWFCKLGFFFWSTTFLQPEKRWIYGIKPPFFLVNHFSSTRKKIRVCKTTFLQPEKNPSLQNHFSRTTFLEKWLQNKWSSDRLQVQKYCCLCLCWVRPYLDSI